MADKQYRVYTVVPRPDPNEKPYWLNIGMAWPNKDGKGFNINLQALPLDGKLVIREYEPEAEQEPESEGAMA